MLIEKVSRDKIIQRVVSLITEGAGCKPSLVAGTVIAEGMITTNDKDLSRVGVHLVKTANQWIRVQLRRAAEYENSQSPQMRLAEELRDACGLLDAGVVAGGENPTPTQQFALTCEYAKLAAHYLNAKTQEILQNNRNAVVRVLIGGGQTNLETVAALEVDDRPRVHFVAAAAIPRTPTTVSAVPGPEAIATMAWAKSGRYPRNLHYGTVGPYDPLYLPIDPHQNRTESLRLIERFGGAKRAVFTKQLYDMAKQEAISALVESMSGDEINMALGSLGVMRFTQQDVDGGSRHMDRISMFHLLESMGIQNQELLREGAVGDFTFNIFDSKGKDQDRWRLFLTPGYGTESSGVKFYQKLVARRCPVMLSTGYRKWEALTVALDRKMFNVLFTDEYTARQLIARAAVRKACDPPELAASN